MHSLSAAEKEIEMTGGGGAGKDLIGPLLVVNLVVLLIVLGLAGWSVDKYINGERNHPHLGGNAATEYMLVFALLGGAVGVCSVVVGLVHRRAWRSDSLAGASSLSLVSWAMIALAFGFEIKQIILGGHRGKRLKTLEAMLIISFLSQFLYVVLLHAGVFTVGYGLGYDSHSSDPTGSSGGGKGRGGSEASASTVT